MVKNMKSLSDIVLKLLGVLLITAAALKGWQLLTEPVANNDIWSYRPFLILTVEFELALGIWLVSGLFKRAAYITALLCFLVFSAITAYKGITGAESCGCFGSVSINPYLTLFAIYIPAVIALLVFRPGNQRHLPWPSLVRLGAVTSVGLAILVITGAVLGFNQPQKATSTYKVLEPQQWPDGQLPILDDIDIGEQLKTGTWLVLFYHPDCPDCIKAMARYRQMERVPAIKRYNLKIAFIHVPSFGNSGNSRANTTNKNINANETTPWVYGSLLATKQWFITTPAVVLLKTRAVGSAWEGTAPDFDAVLHNVATLTYFQNQGQMKE